jgi:hypothetical protein
MFARTAAARSLECHDATFFAGSEVHTEGRCTMAKSLRRQTSGTGFHYPIVAGVMVLTAPLALDSIGARRSEWCTAAAAVAAPLGDGKAASEGPSPEGIGTAQTFQNLRRYRVDGGKTLAGKPPVPPINGDGIGYNYAGRRCTLRLRSCPPTVAGPAGTARSGPLYPLGSIKSR